jgi:protein-S-isoprenylcysteine O-methyltransferase Ste14
MPTLPRLILIGSWALFCLVWVAMAPGAKKDVHRQSIDEREYHGMALIAGIVFTLLPLHGPFRDAQGPIALAMRPMTPDSMVLQWASALAALAGLSLALWSRLALGRNWSARVAIKDEHELVTSGPYAAIRHPIYSALILLFLAIALAVRAPFSILGLALVIMSCWIKLRGEEEMMSEAFPDAYPAYMARTRRLVPGLV